MAPTRRHRADLLVSGGTLVTDSGEWPGVGIAIRGGTIVALGRPDVLPPAEEVFDATGYHVLPGVIDAHVHFREPGMSAKEGFEAGSGSAALGGVTCVIDMPNTEPPTDTAERLRDKLAGIAGRSWVDYACHGLLGTSNVDELVALHAAGVVGVKCFLGQSEAGPGCPAPPDDGTLLEAMTVLAGLGLRLAVHAENHDVMRRLIAIQRSLGRRDLAAHGSSRPPVVEAEAIQRVGLFAEYSGCAVHVLHVSSAEGVQAVRAVRRRGVDLTAETCPHYLFLAGVPDNDVRLRVNPPIRAAADAQALAAALRTGRLQFIASDHAPHRVEEKSGNNVWQVRAGINGVQHLLPLLLAHRTSLGFTLTDVVRVTSYQPSRVWNLWPRKGAIAVGADGDLTVVDLSAPWTVEAASIYSTNRWSPYLGHSGRGAPVATIVRGRIVARDGRLIGEPAGRWVPGNGARASATAAGDRVPTRSAAPQGLWPAGTKLAGLALLTSRGLPVPESVGIPSDSGPGDLDRWIAQLAAGTGRWVVRIDAPPPWRFTVNGGVSAEPSRLAGLIRQLWRSRPSPACGLVVQRRVARELDGIAIRTTAGRVVIETQAVQPGNFFQDGSTPHRWVVAAEPDGTADPPGLPATVLTAVRRALARLPVPCCVEWVLAPDGCVYFVDAKPVPAGFLAAGNVPDGEGWRGCVPVLCGTGQGRLDSTVDLAGTTLAEPRIHVAERTAVDVLSSLGSWSAGVQFATGGLLSHAVVYAAQLNIPIVLCTVPEHTATAGKGWAELTVEPGAHRLTCPADGPWSGTGGGT
jgi:allantoinase